MITGDILIDLETMAPICKDGDFAIGDATLQNQKLLIVCNKNEVKRHPTVCVGAITFLDNENVDELIRETRKEFVKDGMTVKSINGRGDGRMNVDAAYE